MKIAHEFASKTRAVTEAETTLEFRRKVASLYAEINDPRLQAIIDTLAEKHIYGQMADNGQKVQIGLQAYNDDASELRYFSIIFTHDGGEPVFITNTNSLQDETGKLSIEEISCKTVGEAADRLQKWADTNSDFFDMVKRNKLRDEELRRTPLRTLLFPKIFPLRAGLQHS